MGGRREKTKVPREEGKRKENGKGDNECVERETMKKRKIVNHKQCDIVLYHR